MKNIKKILSLLLVVVTVAFAALPAFAAPTPTPTEAFYVNDYADVLSADTIKYIADRSGGLAYSTGAEIVVVTVDFLDGTPIDKYALNLFNEWELGDKTKNNGLLILLAIGEEDYYVTSGDGLNNYLSASLIKQYLNDYLEADFAAGNYDAGVRKVYDKFLTKLETVYGEAAASPPVSNPSTSTPNTSNNSNKNTSSLGSTLLTILTIILVIVVINMVFGLMISLISRMFRSFGGGSTVYYQPVRPRWYSPFWHWGGYYRPRRSPFYGAPPHPPHHGGTNYHGGTPRPGSTPPPPPTSTGGGSFWGRSSSSGGGHSSGSGAGRSSGSFFGGSSSGGSRSSGGSSFGGGRSSGGSSFGGGRSSSGGGGRSSGGGGGRGKH